MYGKNVKCKNAEKRRSILLSTVNPKLNPVFFFVFFNNFSHVFLILFLFYQKYKIL